MKRPEFFKRVLAGSLGFMLVFSDVVPAMAAQPQENVMEAETAKMTEQLPYAVWQETAQPQAEEQQETQAEEQETQTEAEEQEAQTEAEGQEAQPEEEQQKTAVQVGEQQGAETEVQQEEASQAEMNVQEMSAEAKEMMAGTEEQPGTGEQPVAQAAAVPTITTPSIQAEQHSSYTYFYLSYTGTDYEDVELSVTASNTGSVVYSRSYFYSGDGIDSDNFYDSRTGKYDLVSGVTYTFTLRPYAYTYDENDNEVKTYGTAVSVRWTAPTVPAIQGLAVKEMTSSGFVFSHSAVQEGVSVRYEYSASQAFDEKVADVYYSYDDDVISYGNMKPGVTYYVRAYAFWYGMQGAYSNVVQVKAPVAEVTNISTEIFDKGITLSLSANNGSYTGFQIERKEGKGKYQNLTTTIDSRFKDTGLTKNTKYTYRVRAYFYNVDTKKYAYGDYSYKTVETGTAAMNLKARTSGKSAIKLTWKKVSSAAGYDIYRSAGSSESNTVKSGENYNFSKYELVKSLKKKSASFTDKKLTAGYYSYRVKAYKLVKGKKLYFTEDSAGAEVSATFSMSSYVTVYKQAQNPKNGKMSIAWYPVPQAKGYLIERYDDTKDVWVTLKKAGAKATTYTLPASPLGREVQYRIRAYSGNKYSRSSTVYVRGRMAAVTGVKAKASANGITVSWKPVSGAAYYRVFRTADSSAEYNADTKTYSYDGYEDTVDIRVFKAASLTDNYYYTLGSNTTTKLQQDYEAAQKLAYHSPYDTYVSTDKIPGTSVTDFAYSYHRPIYDDKGNAYKYDVETYGPQSDVTYNYYVIAYCELKDATTGSVYTAQSYGASQSASAAISGVAKKAPKMKKVKAGKKSATVTFNKAAGAKKYLVYRSTSKKKGFTLVGTTTKTTFKDKKLKSKKTYYYKLKAVYSNGLGEDMVSGFSAVKSAKVK